MARERFAGRVLEERPAPSAPSATAELPKDSEYVPQEKTGNQGVLVINGWWSLASGPFSVLRVGESPLGGHEAGSLCLAKLRNRERDTTSGRYCK